MRSEERKRKGRMGLGREEKEEGKRREQERKGGGVAAEVPQTGRNRVGKRTRVGKRQDP